MRKVLSIISYSRSISGVTEGLTDVAVDRRQIPLIPSLFLLDQEQINAVIPNGLYGQLGEYLSQHLDVVELQPLTDLIRRHAMDTLPIGPEDGFLGGGGTRRRHSLRSARLTTGVHNSTLRKMLTEIGAIQESDLHKIDNHIICSTSDVDAVVAIYRDAIDLEAVAKRLGLVHVTVLKLMRTGILKPTNETVLKNMLARFSGTAIDAILRSVTDGLEERAESRSLIPLREASRAFGGSQVDVIAGALNGTLKTRYLSEDATRVGLDRILLDRDEVRAAFVSPTPAGLKRHDFARALGLDHHTGNALFDSGLFEVVRVERSGIRRDYDIVTQESFDRFLRDNASLSNLDKGWTQAARLKRLLEDAGVKPIWACRERRIGTFYRRSDVEAYREANP